MRHKTHFDAFSSKTYLITKEPKMFLLEDHCVKRSAWAGFNTAEEGRAKIIVIIPYIIYYSRYIIQVILNKLYYKRWIKKLYFKIYLVKFIITAASK